jgi:hypothetical protein
LEPSLRHVGFGRIPILRQSKEGARMRNLVAGLGAWLVLSGAAAAAPCVPDSLAGYIGLGAAGCTIGLNTFSGFQTFAAPGAATPIEPGDVAVNPVVAASGSGFDFILNSTAGGAAGAGDLFEILIGYQVSGSNLTSARVQLDGATATGDGVVTAVTDLCAAFAAFGPGTCDPGPLQTLIALRSEEVDDLASDPLFALLATPLGVVTDIAVDGGIGGSASLSSAGNRFGLALAVPEPSTVLLLALALGLIASIGRHRGPASRLS